MWEPAHLDGRTLVIIRPQGGIFGGFEAVASGRLTYDGRQVELVAASETIPISDAESGAVQPVLPQTRIAVCRGFDLFLLRD